MSRAETVLAEWGPWRDLCIGFAVSVVAPGCWVVTVQSMGSPGPGQDHMRPGRRQGRFAIRNIALGSSIATLILVETASVQGALPQGQGWMLAREGGAAAQACLLCPGP